MSDPFARRDNINSAVGGHFHQAGSDLSSLGIHSSRLTYEPSTSQIPEEAVIIEVLWCVVHSQECSKLAFTVNNHRVGSVFSWEGVAG